MYAHVYVCVCLCVCVRERERERNRESMCVCACVRVKFMHMHIHMYTRKLESAKRFNLIVPPESAYICSNVFSYYRMCSLTVECVPFL